MSEQLLEALQAALTGHGIEAQRSGGIIRTADGLTLEPRVLPRETVRGTAQVQVDFVIGSPRLNGLPFLDSFGGVGDTPERAEFNAAGKFLQGSLQVIVAALTAHPRAPDQVDWEDWAGTGHAWRVCAGPLLMIASREGARIAGFEDFFPRLKSVFCESAAAGPHWMRVFLGTLGGQHTGSELLVDGEVWTAGQELLDAHTWIYPEGYASFRHLLIALPRDG